LAAVNVAHAQQRERIAGLVTRLRTIERATAERRAA
jgi:hypothetical protein